jgi:hypothetical protein
MTSRLLISFTLGAAGLVAGCHTTPSTPIDDLAAEAGLQRAQTVRLDALYVNPNVTFGDYKKVLLRPVVVSFRESWRPERTGTHFQLSATEMNRLKQDFETTFMRVFAHELQARDGYELVSAPGPGVLEIRARITDLFIPAADLSRYSITRTRTFVRDGSEMTLTAEVRDSLSGQVLSRAYDQGRATTNPTFEEANRLTNTMDARRIISTWATQLRSSFDGSRTDRT